MAETISFLSHDERQRIHDLFSRQAFWLSINRFMMPAIILGFPILYICYARFGLDNPEAPYKEELEAIFIMIMLVLFPYFALYMGHRSTQALLNAEKKRVCHATVTWINGYRGTRYNQFHILLENGEKHSVMPRSDSPILQTGDKIIVEEAIAGTDPFTKKPYYGILKITPLSDLRQ